MDSDRERIFGQYEDAIHVFSAAVEAVKNGSDHNFLRAMQRVEAAHDEVEKWARALQDYDRERGAASSDGHEHDAKARHARAR